MPALHIRDMPRPLYQRLAELAAAHQRSPEEEALALLQQAVHLPTDVQSQRDLLDDLKRRRFIPPPGTPDSVQLLREDRDR